MANTTMTYVTAIDIAIKAIGNTNPEAVERLNALTAQLNKRGSKSGPTKTQKLNEKIKDIILEILAEAEDYVPMASLLEDDRLTGLVENDEPIKVSPQKAGALLGQLIKTEKVVKTVYKKRTLYAIAGTEFVAPDAEVTEGEDASLIGGVCGLPYQNRHINKRQVKNLVRCFERWYSRYISESDASAKSDSCLLYIRVRSSVGRAFDF